MRRVRPVREKPFVAATSLHLSGVEPGPANMCVVRVCCVFVGSLLAHSDRFKNSAVSAVDSGTPEGLGPGAYEAHQFSSIAMAVTKEVQMMSRQNPGFGIAGPAHKLPHEQPVEDDKEFPCVCHARVPRRMRRGACHLVSPSACAPRAECIYCVHTLRARALVSRAIPPP